eukprot:scaffold495_cov152-Skeletonema_menzelii.AAC.19
MSTTSSDISSATQLSSISAALSSSGSNSEVTATPPLPSSSVTNSPPKLSLSAYRRPENTVRLTDADPSQHILSKYDLLDPSLCRTLGHGASSTVQLAYRRSDNLPVAVKTIAKHAALRLWSKTNRWQTGARRSMSSPRDGADELLQQRDRRRPRLEEVDVLMGISGICPDVVQLLDVYETNQEVHLVLEYCHGGDLFDCIKRRRQTQIEKGLILQGIFSEAETASVAKTLLSVLDVLHQKHLVHRDIKPENILLVNEDDGSSQLHVKLTDFGLARILDGEDEEFDTTTEDPAVRRSRAYSRVGSDYYAAPEVYMGLGYDTPVDIYSLGVTLYVMLVGCPPSTSTFSFDTDSDFSDEDSSATSDSEQSAPSSQLSSRTKLFPPEMNVSPSAQELITSMIHPDATKRISASAALKHEWILNHSASQEDVEMATMDMSSKLSISLPSTNRSALTTTETEAFLRLPFQVFPPSNSPAAKDSADSAVTLTLTDVCSKLVPIANRHGQQKKKRSRHRSHSRSEIQIPSPKTRNISDLSGEELSKVITATPTKKVRVESRKSSPSSLYASPLRVAA